MRRKIMGVIGLMAVIALTLTLTACQTTSAPASAEMNSAATEGHEETDALPQVAAASLSAGEHLRVVATTSLIGDAVRRVAGDLVDLTVLSAPGSDPHTYVATPQDMIALDNAHIIFVNGLGLEEALLPTLDNLGGQTPVASVNVGVKEISHEEEEHEEHEEHHHHGGVDPHTWQDVANMAIWVENIALVLAERDPANAGQYEQAAASYRRELEQLDQEVRAILAAIPPEKRKLVTEHDNMRYFANAYDFTVVGAVIPSFSTLATISAQEMAGLQQQIVAEGVTAIFVGPAVSSSLAVQVADDVGVTVTPLYTDSLSALGAGAATYVEMMRSNAKRIVEALTSSP